MTRGAQICVEIYRRGVIFCSRRDWKVHWLLTFGDVSTPLSEGKGSVMLPHFGNLGKIWLGLVDGSFRMLGRPSRFDVWLGRYVFRDPPPPG